MTQASDGSKLGWTAKVGVAALSYFVAGELGLLLALPPGLASPVWPAAGIALAVVLLFGSRVWPGVLVGAFFVNGSHTFDTTTVGAVIDSIATPLAVSAGATLQAVAGGYLIRRYAQFPGNYQRSGDAVRSMLLGGPFSCVVSPTIATITLFVAQRIELHHIPETWGLWWVGDTIGALMFVPLVSAVETERRHATRRTLWLVGIPVLVAATMIVGAYLGTRAQEWQTARRGFEGRAQAMTRTLEQTLESKFDVIRSVVSLIETDDVTRSAFGQIVRPTFDRHHDLLALGWDRRIDAGERDQVVAQVQQEGIPDFRITELDANGELVEAGERPEHVVIFYIEPEAGNEQALGYDLASNPDRRAALLRARDTGEVTATRPIVLVQDTIEKPAILFAAPVFRPRPRPDTLAARRANLHSYVSGVFYADATVQAAFSAFGNAGVDYHIADTADPNQPHSLFGVPQIEPLNSGPTTDFKWTGEIDVAGRRWTVSFWPNADFEGAPNWVAPWGVLTGGLFGTSMLGALLLITAGRSAQTERTNEELRTEVRERKRAEIALTESERRFRAVFDASTIGVIIAEPGGRFLEVNDYVHTMLGFEPGELVGRTLADIAASTCEPDETTDVVTGEREYVGKDGRIVWSLVRSTQVRDADDDVQFVLSVIEDMTLRRKFETELLKTQKLESLGVLAGGIAHDFNNLLTAVGGNVELAMQDLPESSHRLLNNAFTALRRASGLTGQLLTFSKGGAPVRKPVDLPELIKEWAGFALTGSMCRFELRADPGLSRAMVDAGQISQVIGNIVINADQAMTRGGIVRIDVRNCELEGDNSLLLPPGRYVAISVADQGVGIEPDHLARIFDPFFTTKDNGTGLGLATAYSIIKQHDGAIEADSVPGVGTTIRVYLPEAKTASDHTTDDRELLPPIDGARILVMDDEELVRTLVARIVTQVGCEVETARDGVEAIERYRKAQADGRPFAAVILDLTVPGGMGGAETVRRLRDLDPAVKAIVSSGYSDDPVLANYAEHGFCGVVAKPYSIAELRLALQRVVVESTRSGQTHAP